MLSLKEITLNSIEDVMAYIIPQKDTLEARQFIAAYLARNPHKAFPLEMNREQA